ncbi:MAG: zinc ribbon domain-containing protein [Acidobacteria bacterium]|nr:zinc ribbon domain-containing protein [Acidobacteriota bacterium]
MPLYEYECSKCEHRFEKIEKVTAPHRQKCPKCKGVAERMHSAPAIQFKGSGWYVTDYGRGRSVGEAKSDKSEKSAAETKETKEKAEKKEPAKKEHKK